MRCPLGCNQSNTLKLLHKSIRLSITLTRKADIKPIYMGRLSSIPYNTLSTSAWIVEYSQEEGNFICSQNIDIHNNMIKTMQTEPMPPFVVTTDTNKYYVYNRTKMQYTPIQLNRNFIIYNDSFYTMNEQIEERKNYYQKVEINELFVKSVNPIVRVVCLTDKTLFITLIGNIWLDITLHKNSDLYKQLSEEFINNLKTLEYMHILDDFKFVPSYMNIIYAQIPGVDFTETFCPVVRHTSFRILFGLAVQLD